MGQYFCQVSFQEPLQIHSVVRIGKCTAALPENVHQFAHAKRSISGRGWIVRSHDLYRQEKLSADAVQHLIFNAALTNETIDLAGENMFNLAPIHPEAE